MNKVILTIGLVLICTAHCYPQMAQTRSRTTAGADASATAKAKDTTANANDKSVNLASGTRLSGELQNSIDVRKAKVGDEVVLKTTQAIKSQGRTVVNRGARLIGHITEVSQKTEASGESHVAIMFDRIQSGSLDTAIDANILAVTKTQPSRLASDSEIDGNSNTTAPSRPVAGSQRSSSSGSLVGGVVGGVTNSTATVASDVLGNTTTAVGSTVNGAANAAGAITSPVGGPLGRIRISESTDASASGGSVLSLRGDNLRLEKGTTFVLVLTQAVGENPQ